VVEGGARHRNQKDHCETARPASNGSAVFGFWILDFGFWIVTEFVSNPIQNPNIQNLKSN
jgi:hypothetical protein